MSAFFICPQNVVKTANLILELDSVAINERYYRHSVSTFQQLKLLLEQYAKAPLREINIDRLEAQLVALIACVREGMAFLTPEALQQVSELVVPIHSMELRVQ